MKQMPVCDLLIVDEIDETVLEYPYAFASGPKSQLNGIWNWKDQKVIGLSATTYGEIQMIIEDAVTDPAPAALLKFKSEYEFVTQKSTLNGNLVVLPQGADIMPHIIERCASSYTSRPIICFLEQADWDVLKGCEEAKDWKFYDSTNLSQIRNLKRGILLLLPSQYRGLNTQFAISALVLIGCKVTSDA